MKTFPCYRYPSPIPCGPTQGDFGATCSATSGGADKRCVCEINCRSPMYFREASSTVKKHRDRLQWTPISVYPSISVFGGKKVTELYSC